MSTPEPYPYRQLAEQHVASAKALLKGKGQDLIYACLDLRLAIEALAYDILQNYVDDVGEGLNAAFQHWQPGKVLDKLRTYDPLADTALRIEMHEVGPDGGLEEGPPTFVGTDDRFTAEWAKKAHRSMGRFLHQRTISQLKKGEEIDEAVLLRKATEVIERLDPILASEVIIVRLRVQYEYPCPECEAGLNVAAAFVILEEKAMITCPACGVDWVFQPGDGSDSPRFSRKPKNSS